VLKEHYGKVHNISYKGKLDLVTDVDCRSEDIIVSFLNREFPDHGILAEERSEVSAQSLYRWILDPLDGTTNYAHGYPFFCVSLALEHKNKIVWGSVLDPLRDELFTAELGRGAFLNNAGIKVSSTNSLERAFLCTGFPYDVHESPDNNLEHFAKFATTAQAVRRDGAAALDLCYVGMGRFDGFWEIKLKPWDIAAGCLIVAEAGGAATGFNGMPVDMKKGEVVASNALIHTSMVSMLSKTKGSSHA